MHWNIALRAVVAAVFVATSTLMTACGEQESPAGAESRQKEQEARASRPSPSPAPVEVEVEVGAEAAAAAAAAAEEAPPLAMEPIEAEPQSAKMEAPENGAHAPCAALDMALFPWPNPPQPSVTAPIPIKLLFGQDSPGKTLLDVGRRLDGAAADAGYLQAVYLGAGCNGFAMVLDLEHIRPDGRRKPGTASLGPSSQQETFSLASYLARLFYAPPGLYRQIVLVVSDEGMAQTTAPPTESELRSIARDGSTSLPPAFADVPYSWKHKVLALIYEFEKHSGDGNTQLIPPTGRLGATEHLKQAKLY